MRKKPAADLVRILSEAAAHLGADSFTISMPIICDHCGDDDKEAFPYCVEDRDGKEWDHLCNDCYDELGCEYDFSDEEWWDE